MTDFCKMPSETEKGFEIADATVRNMAHVINDLFDNVLIVKKADFIFPREEFKSVLEILEENYINSINDEVLGISLELNGDDCLLTLQRGGARE